MEKFFLLIGSVVFFTFISLSFVNAEEIKLVCECKSKIVIDLKQNSHKSTCDQKTQHLRVDVEKRYLIFEGKKFRISSLQDWIIVSEHSFDRDIDKNLFFSRKDERIDIYRYTGEMVHEEFFHYQSKDYEKNNISLFSSSYNCHKGKKII